MATDVLRYINLARKIKAKSEAGQINWSPASLVETYEAFLGTDGLVAIQKLPNKSNHNVSNYSLMFKNGLGQTFYTLRDLENKSFPDLNSVLAGIYSSAESMQVRANGGSWLSGMETFVDAL